MSYAVVYGQNLSTYSSRREAMKAFVAVVYKNASARLFAITDDQGRGASYQDITPAILTHQA